MAERPICPYCKVEMSLLGVEGRLITYKCPFCGYRAQYEDPDLRGSIIEDPQASAPTTLYDLPDYSGLW